jgi:hypothetical protein
MSPSVFVDCLASLLEYSRLICKDLDKEVPNKLELEWIKHRRALPEKQPALFNTETVRAEILSIIENKVLLRAVNCETLPPDIKLSVDRTILRIHSMRTIEEIVGFFNNAMRSERGIVVEAALHKEGLLAFDDIKDEINRIFNNNH